MKLVQTDRRQFLREFSMGILALTLGPIAVSAKSIRRSPMKNIPIEELRYATFSSHLNSLFRVNSSDGLLKLDLKLIETSLRDDSSARGAVPVGESFSILFSGPADSILRQGCHRFSHPEIGSFEMFVTPVASRNPAEVHYEAVFNRLQPTDDESASQQIV